MFPCNPLFYASVLNFSCNHSFSRLSFPLFSYSQKRFLIGLTNQIPIPPLILTSSSYHPSPSSFTSSPSHPLTNSSLTSSHQPYPSPPLTIIPAHAPTHQVENLAKVAGATAYSDLQRAVGEAKKFGFGSVLIRHGGVGNNRGPPKLEPEFCDSSFRFLPPKYSSGSSV